MQVSGSLGNRILWVSQLLPQSLFSANVYSMTYPTCDVFPSEIQMLSKTFRDADGGENLLGVVDSLLTWESRIFLGKRKENFFSWCSSSFSTDVSPDCCSGVLEEEEDPSWKERGKGRREKESPPPSFFHLHWSGRQQNRVT